MEQRIAFNKTKIVATVGPACNSREKLKELALAGVDVFRLNFSHGSHEEHLQVVQYVRSINEELGTHIALLQDLQGPKIRTREVENNGVELKAGQELVITTERVLGNSHLISTSYEAMPQDVKSGDMILVDDGKIELRVERSEGNKVFTRVIYGGILKSRKGINLPMTDVSAPSLTEKDEEDLVFGMQNDLDWIALSFVRTADDVLSLKEKIRKAGKYCKVMAKVEKPEALKNIDAIIRAADGIMVARGDLGVETQMEEVPMVQKMIVRKCNDIGKPVIIATQMMESMITNPRPTRAETNDIANAVSDGADALMLSAETAAGQYPLEVIKSMVRTILSVEENMPSIYFKHENVSEQSATFLNDSIVLQACRLAKKVKANAIVGMTKSGYTGYRIASHRPKANVFIFTNNRPLMSSLNLLWGIRCFYYDKMESTDQTFTDITNYLKEMGCLFEGNILIHTASMPIQAKARTNTIKLTVVD
ncbi:pyruvate kinase [Cesiribacter andamanensis]|uniref:Pyruvate kinase n=1 Tax=Cesiribacter andamanensis AMV16 TaxID=1279009 RepID=M7N6Z4_9BACT|nr:pyruvate kinase [Cesiribacter andamanensis]EMR03047.1 Pyruvate kinase [Cesiribacter andamanensis AMV16]